MLEPDLFAGSIEKILFFFEANHLLIKYNIYIFIERASF